MPVHLRAYETGLRMADGFGIKTKVNFLKWVYSKIKINGRGITFCGTGGQYFVKNLAKNPGYSYYGWYLE